MLLCVWWWIRRQKANCQLEKITAPPSQRLAQQSSGGCQRSTAIYVMDLWGRQGSRRGATVHSVYVTTTTTTMMMMIMTVIMKYERLGSKRKVLLTFRVAYRLSGTGIVECLEIIDVWCNLMAWSDWSLAPRFYDRSTPLCMSRNISRRQCKSMHPRGFLMRNAMHWSRKTYVAIRIDGHKKRVIFYVIARKCGENLLKYYRVYNKLLLYRQFCTSDRAGDPERYTNRSLTYILVAFSFLRIKMNI